jgi:N-acetylglucosaminyldiphosphoundecaprenol N-acetyl-beta-D-mannosaminyltransferase
MGIRIDNWCRIEALGKVGAFIVDKKQHMIFTPNPEMLVDTQKDGYFREVLNKADLNICDGKGIQLVSKEKLERIPGSDFMIDICSFAEQNKYSVFFLGSRSRAVTEKLTKNVQDKFRTLKIVGSHQGLSITKLADGQISYNKDENNELVAEIVMARPDILFVAFGHGKQEKWIYENLTDMPSVKIAMGVGGAFDYISGSKKRAPSWMRSLGMEWFFRLLYEPKRVGRIWKATFIFLFINIFKKAS